MSSKCGKRIVFATIGSLGDLHPCLALGLELKRRGHSVAIAATPFYREKIENSGLEFKQLRPDWNPTDVELIRRCENIRQGPEILFRELVLPYLRETYEDLLAAVTEPGNMADLVIAGELVYPAPMISEQMKLPWVSLILSPNSFFSAHDPSVLVNVPGLIYLRKLGWRAYRFALEAGKLAAQHWWKPVSELRRELGLRAECDPLFADKFSDDLVLALFSHWLAEPQPDWPPHTRQPGFVFFDGEDNIELPAEAKRFLTDGNSGADAPIVFTLGSAAVYNPGNFFEASVAAARRLGRRAILIGAGLIGAGPEYSSSEILSIPYAPYSLIFPHAAAIVHQGGAGTTAQAMRAGKPQLIVPYAWDQPDNAARIARLGTGLYLTRKAYSATTATAALSDLLGSLRYSARAAEVGKSMSKEDALSISCDEIEAVLNRSRATVNDGRVQSARG